MKILTQLALGSIGQFKPRPPREDVDTRVLLPRPTRSGGMPLMQALQLRQSQRDFAPDALREQQLSDLLWAAAGVNRHDLGGRTAPSAMNCQEVTLYVGLPGGLYRYEAADHELCLELPGDVRAVSGHQDFASTAPVDLIYVADHARMKLVPAEQRAGYAFATAGAMAQNVYLYSASEGLAAVLRAWFERDALSVAMGLCTDQQLLLAQTVGMPKAIMPP
jgi:nitroreductase